MPRYILDNAWVAGIIIGFAFGVPAFVLWLVATQ